MSENGGELTVGQRLTRIEEEIKGFKTHVDERITRHRKVNEQTVKELAMSIVRDFGGRLEKLEKHDVAEDAVKSQRKWLIGIGITVLGIVLANLMVLLQIVGKVGE